MSAPHDDTACLYALSDLYQLATADVAAGNVTLGRPDGYHLTATITTDTNTETVTRRCDTGWSCTCHTGSHCQHILAAQIASQHHDNVHHLIDGLNQ